MLIYWIICFTLGAMIVTDVCQQIKITNLEEKIEKIENTQNQGEE